MKKKKNNKLEILAEVSCIIYKVIEPLISDFSLQFLLRRPHHPPIVNHFSLCYCHFPSHSLSRCPSPSNDPFLPVL